MSDLELAQQITETLASVMACVRTMSKNIDELVHCVKTQDATIHTLHERILKLEGRYDENPRPEFDS